MRLITRLMLMLTVLLLVALCAEVSQHPPSDSNNAPVKIDSIVQLRTTTGRCTGFIAGRGLIATAGHCIDPTDLIQRAYFTDGTSVPYKVLSYVNNNDCVDDWALLVADTGTRMPVSFGLAPQVGEMIFRSGYDKNSPERQRMHYGWLLGTTAKAVNMSRLAVPGESGSPIFNSSGKVFAIVTCRVPNNMSTIGSRTRELVKLVARVQRVQ